MAKILIGLDNFYYSLVSLDTTAAITYQAPVALKGAVSVGVNLNSEVTTIFADDGPFDTAENMGQIELDVTIVDCSQEDYATLMGHTIVAGVLQESVSDQPPDLAFGFRALRSNSAYSYIWLLKGKFSKPEVKHETKADKLVFQTLTFKGKFTQRIYDGLYKKSTRTDATDYVAGMGSAWFSSVYGTTAETTSPTFLSSTPTAGSTTASRSAGATMTVTFSEPILSSTVIESNFTLIVPTAGTTIPITSMSVVSSTVTFVNPALTASTTHNLIIGTGVKDLVGNAMTGAYTLRFTTVA
jgi:phi13 family phage major tail protein